MKKSKRKIEIWWLHDQDESDHRIVLTTTSKLYPRSYLRCYGVMCGVNREILHQSRWSYYPLKAKEDIGFTYIGKL